LKLTSCKKINKLNNYIKNIAFTSIIITLTLVLWLVFTDVLNPVLIKWTAFSFYLSILSSGLIILNNYSLTLSKASRITITSFGIGLLIYFGLVLFSTSFSNQIYNLIGLSILFLMLIQLNILGWSKQNHSIGIKLLFLFSLLSNLFISSIFFFSIDLYEIKPFLISSILISFSLLIVGIIIHNKKVNHILD